jgi:fatty acid desaturase
MKLWKHTPLDCLMLALSVAQLVTTFLFAASWDQFSMAARLGCFALQVFMITYNVIVISHLFTHNPWFLSRLLNRLASMLNSINIGQSVQAYELMHVRNHHRYNNDRKGPAGKTNDLSSTFQDGAGGEHATLFRYAVMGALSTFVRLPGATLAVWRLWRLGPHEQGLLKLAARNPGKRREELWQVQMDRMANFAAICFFWALSWRWTLFCYLPAFYLALVLVNVQNYFEHYGALPGDRFADSVSHYGRLYNLLTFNDGYHQEHHLRPHAHWSRMPEVRRLHQDQLNSGDCIVCPVPAMFGMLHRNRMPLHKRKVMARAAQPENRSA